MLNVHDRATLSRALTTSIDLRLKRLLTERIQQLNVEDLSTAARFIIVQEGDHHHGLARSVQSENDRTSHCQLR